MASTSMVNYHKLGFHPTSYPRFTAEQNIVSLQSRCSRIVATLLLKDPDHLLDRERFSRLPFHVKREPYIYYIHFVLMRKIGWKQKILSEANVASNRSEGLALRHTKLACSYNGKRLFSGGATGVLRVWDIDNASMHTRAHFNHPITAVKCTADGSLAYFRFDNGDVFEWDVLEGTCKRILRTFRRFACSSDGSQLFSISPTHALAVVEFRSNTLMPLPKRIKNRDFNSYVTVMTCSSDGSKVFVGLSCYKLLIWDRVAGRTKMLDYSPYTTNWTAAACDDEGRYLHLVWGCFNHFTTIDRFNYDKSHYNPSQDSQITVIACTSDGQKVFTGNRDGELYLTYGSKMRLIGEVPIIPSSRHVQGAGITSIACSADGSRVFTYSTGLIAMWTGYTQDLKRLDDMELTTLFHSAKVWHEQKKPCYIDLTSRSCVDLLTRLPYLQREDLFLAMKNPPNIN